MWKEGTATSPALRVRGQLDWAKKPAETSGPMNKSAEGEGPGCVVEPDPRQHAVKKAKNSLMCEGKPERGGGKKLLRERKRKVSRLSGKIFVKRG